MRARPFLICVVLILFISAVWISTRSATSARHELSALTPQRFASVRSSTTWSHWSGSPSTANVDARLRNLLSQARTAWQQQSAEPFEIVRGFSKAPQQTQFVCTHFEKQHALGRAADVRVADLNKDGRTDLADLCLFAKQLGNPRGTTAVYGWQGTKQQELWVHVDVDGIAERWGEWRIETQAAQFDAQPVFWSDSERSATSRCRLRQLPTNAWRLVADKKPIAHVFDLPTGVLRRQPVLHLYAGKQHVKSYPVALGYDPVNDKQKRDDYRTPEGDFYLCGANAQSQFHKSLRLSYPNAEDAKRGLRQGLIDDATLRKIVRAIKRKRTPPQDTRLGGDIMLHGGGGQRDNWTWGCIALDNNHIDELFALLPYGTPIKVLPAR